MKIFKKSFLESVETLFASQKWFSGVLLTKEFPKLFKILKSESKVRCKGLKSDFTA